MRGERFNTAVFRAFFLFYTAGKLAFHPILCKYSFVRSGRHNSYLIYNSTY